MKRLIGLLTALAVLTSLLADPTRVAALVDFVQVTAPVSAGFQAFQTGDIVPAVAERSLGHAPSPVDLSHLTSVHPNAQDGLVAPAQYDLRTLGRVSPVKNQGTCGCCWAFAAYGSLESVVYPTEQWDFSEQNVKNLSGFDYGACGGGDAVMAIAYMARWDGPVREADDPYNPVVSTSSSGLAVPRYLSAALAIPDRSGPLDNAALKSAVQQWGAVDTTMLWEDGSYNAGHHSYYYSGSGTSNHDVAIVGWDDSYSHLNFKTAPAGDGAFIIRNSWGTSWGDGGYFYVSYHDTVIGHDNWVFVLQTGTPMDTHNYGYDDLGWVGHRGFVGSSTAWGANVFTLDAGSGSEVIDRVGFYTTSSGASYTLRIYGTVSGAVFSNLLTQETGEFDEAGYHAVSLASPVTVAHGQKIAVVVGMTTPGYDYPLAYEYPEVGYSSAAHAALGESYVSSNGTSWNDLTLSKPNANLCIRAFTHDAVVPVAPVLSSPATGSTTSSLTLTLSWAAAAGATSYTVQVGLSSGFSTTVVNQSISGTSFTTPSLAAGTPHYWRVNATNATATSAWSSTWTFTTLAAPTYTLTPSAGTGGTITPNTPQTVAQGGSKTFTIAPTSGYHVQDVLVDGGSAVAVTTYTFTNVQTNHTIHASFAPNTYTLTTTASPSAGGSIGKAPNAASYASGTVVTLTVTPAVGYTFTGWSGDLSGMTNPTTVAMTGNKTVTAMFTPTVPGTGLILSASWNLVSVPIPLPTSSITGLQAVYGYHDGWSVPTTLVPGNAYWVQVQNAVTVPLPGTPATAPISLVYQAGWQLLGNPFDVPLSITSITNHALITTCYSYGPAWGILNPATDSLQSGKGYWIQLSSPATLTLSLSSVGIGVPEALEPGQEATVPMLTPTFFWNAVPGATRYTFWLGSGWSGSGDSELSSYLVTGTSFALPVPLVGGSQYTWNVAAGDAATWGDWGEDQHFTVQIPAGLTVTTLLTPVPYAMNVSRTATFTWTPAPGATRYSFWLGTGTSGSGDTQILGVVVTGTSYTVPAGMLEAGGVYTWNVAIGTATTWGSWTMDRYFMVAP